MLHNNTYDLDLNSLNNARTVALWQSHYESLKKSVWKFVAVVLAVPLFFFLALWVRSKRKSFTKHMRLNRLSLNKAEEYQKVRTHLDEVRFLYPVLKKAKDLNVKKMPWSFRFCAVQMKKMSSTLLQYFKWLEKELHSLNTEQFKSPSKTFKFTSEKELWQNRNKAYQYWM